MTTTDLILELERTHGKMPPLVQKIEKVTASELGGKTMKQYVKERVKPSVEADWERLKRSPGWRKK
jgi:hypothetical protein